MTPTSREILRTIKASLKVSLVLLTRTQVTVFFRIVNTVKLDVVHWKTKTEVASTIWNSMPSWTSDFCMLTDSFSLTVKINHDATFQPVLQNTVEKNV